MSPTYMTIIALVADDMLASMVRQRSVSPKLAPIAASAYFCHACGRHTDSHRKELAPGQQATPPKFCSQRCRGDGRPSVVVAATWKRILDERVSAKRNQQGVMCSEVEEQVYDRATGGMRGAEISSTDDKQQLGMRNAQNRESVRRSARLLVHSGFPHFLVKRSPADTSEAIAELEGEERRVEAVLPDGKPVPGGDVTMAKGEWGLRWAKDV